MIPKLKKKRKELECQHGEVKMDTVSTLAKSLLQLIPPGKRKKKSIFSTKLSLV